MTLYVCFEKRYAIYIAHKNKVLRPCWQMEKAQMSRKVD